MKKAIVYILTLTILILGTTANAASINLEIPKVEGSFSVRNGILFGMSGKEVEQIEKKQGSEEAIDSGNWKKYIVYEGSVAGYSQSTIHYYFVDNNNMEDLYSFDYMFGMYDSWSASAATKVFNEMADAIINKYGKPIYTAKDEVLFPILSSAYNYLGVVDDFYDLRDFSQWIVEYDDEYVVIDVVLSQMNRSIISSEYPYYCHVGYRRISKQEFEQIISQIETTQQNNEDAKNNDL